jgi:hypothetical protein
MSREFWSQDDNGRDFCLAIAFTDEEAMAVWDSLRRARAYVEERTHDEGIYKGRFLRSWSEDEGTLWREDLEAKGIVP